MKHGSFIALALLSGLIQACCVVERLEFDNLTVPQALLNQEYKAVITARVKNNPSDDNFFYHLDFTGVLPEGLELIKDEEHRRFIIRGTPIEYGSFEFTLKVSVEHKPSPDDQQDTTEVLIEAGYNGITEELLCQVYDEKEQAYTLTVTTM